MALKDRFDSYNKANPAYVYQPYPKAVHLPDGTELVAKDEVEYHDILEEFARKNPTPVAEVSSTTTEEKVEAAPAKQKVVQLNKEPAKK